MLRRIIERHSLKRQFLEKCGMQLFHAHYGDLSGSADIGNFLE
jgi:hypothetical protein